MLGESEMSEAAACHGPVEHRIHRRDEIRALPLPLSDQALSSTLVELQPGMSKAVEICYDCWKVIFDFCNIFAGFVFEL
jgi:hypothetical protein